MKEILGKKLGMTQIFSPEGLIIPVTVVEAGPCSVLQRKTVEKDGYVAVQVGLDEKKESRANKPEKGHAKKAGVTPFYHLRELRGDEMTGYNLGDKITVDMFKAGDIVDVIGTSKGKGYSGTIKRWHMHIGPKGHGSGYHRGQGSFANQGRYNHGVMPGKHMSGHHGNKSATLLNLTVVAVDVERNAILIKGGLPGSKKSLVVIRSAIKAQLGTPVEVKPLIDRTKAETQE